MRFDLSGYALGQYVMPTLICTTPTSDLWITDSAEGQIAVAIEPFHGNLLGVYKFNERFEQIAQYPLDFGHVAWVGEVFGKAVVIVGSRGGEKELELIDINTEERIVIEKDVGSTQITVYREKDAVYILSANHGSNEVALYSIEL